MQKKELLKASGCTSNIVEQLPGLINEMRAAGVIELDVRVGDSNLFIKLGEGTLVHALSTVPVEPQQPAEPSYEGEQYEIVTSPLNQGIFYRAPKPGEPPFVEIGDYVDEGQTLCLIDSNKQYNSINSECSGTVVKIYLNNSVQVKKGDPLIVIDKSGKPPQIPSY